MTESEKDGFLLVLLVLMSVALGFCLGYQHSRGVTYAACENREPLVIEVSGVRQVYACQRIN